MKPYDRFQTYSFISVYLTLCLTGIFLKIIYRTSSQSFTIISSKVIIFRWDKVASKNKIYCALLIVQYYHKMNKDFQYYEMKVRELQHENQMLKDHLNLSQRNISPLSPQAFIEIQSRNQRLERQAQKFQKSIKGDLSMYIADTSVHPECFYRNRYSKLLSYPKNHYKVYY